jgi:hypothetical protein
LAPAPLALRRRCRELHENQCARSAVGPQQRASLHSLHERRERARPRLNPHLPERRVLRVDVLPIGGAVREYGVPVVWSDPSMGGTMSGAGKELTERCLWLTADASISEETLAREEEDAASLFCCHHELVQEGAPVRYVARSAVPGGCYDPWNSRRLMVLVFAEKRQAEAQRIRSKYPDRIPVRGWQQQ